MLEPILAEDSSILKLVPSLEGIVKDLKEDATHHDYFVALLIVFLAESGFHATTTTDNCHSECSKLKSLRIPKHWKSQETGIYEMMFRLAAVPDVECKFVAIPSGDTLIVNFFSVIDKRNIYSIAVQCLKYVNPFSSDLSGRYINLKAISHRFKDALATPLRSDVLTRAGFMCPSLQGLPTELKLKIIGMLDYHSLWHTAQCSSEFDKLRQDLCK
ncbi:F-box only protein 7 [Andrena cerasifolii]|uniref:F-box only protein 7 n=1 Tax=Andrena cerasifolii TaxID=2819439 RepID=UPI004037F3A9